MDIKGLLNPNKTVLVVVDKQAGYFDPAFVRARNKNLPDNAATVLEAIDRFIENARKANVEVIWTQMVEDVELSPKNISTKMKFDQFQSIAKPGHPSFEIFGRITPTSEEKVVKKYMYNAFAGTDLSAYLKAKSIENVILVGGYGSRCVLSTAVGANGENLTTIIPRGLIINQVSDQSEIDLTYSIVSAIFGYVVDTESILSSWETQNF